MPSRKVVQIAGAIIMVYNMNIEKKVVLRIIGLFILLMSWGAILYRYFSVWYSTGLPDVWMFTAFCFTLFPATHIIQGIDNDLKLFYGKNKGAKI
ncbi:MAG: hypothetical protein NTW30_05885 [Candidatus Aenigmarchaeota archaeon]|nr:hypothetical protein [Candidatus Aenigmarchaeota archaeon]